MKDGARRLAALLPPLAVNEADGDMLTDLAETLAMHNIQQFNTLLVTKDGFADPRRWKELRRRDGVRVYRERARAATPGIPVTPSLLLLGTLQGSLDDVMYGVSAHSDEAIRLHSTCTQDGVVDSKVLHELVRPSLDEPFRHVSVKWRLHANSRDYVSLDASGIALTVKRERVGYNIMHSVAFAQVPSFDASHGVERGNMSVCALYRQKTPGTVEVYVRGFFDFHTQSDVLNSMSLQTLSNQWLSIARGVECARMKKLVWQMRKNSGCTAAVNVDQTPPEPYPAMSLAPLESTPSESLESVRSTNSLASRESSQLPSQSMSSAMMVSFSSFSSSSTIDVMMNSSNAGACRGCRRTFGLLASTRKTCKCCFQPVCTRCCARRLVCVVAPDKRSVLEKRRTFCLTCLDAVDKCDPVAVAREELLSSCSFRQDWLEEVQHATAAAYVPSAVLRQSRVGAGVRTSASRRSASIYS
jgi:hypothetical protein